MKGALLLVLVGSCQAQGDHPEPPMQCPGHPDGLLSHAKASLFLNPKASCPIVEAEIRARVKGVNGWVDPHNHGTYTMLSDAAGVMRLKRVTGNGKYTDMLMFTFSDWGGDYGCQVTACSESQVNSLFDASTNFCNLHDLYCGKEDGCPVAGQDIGEYKEEFRTFSRGAGKDKSKCIVKESAVAAVATAEDHPEPPMQCPGAPDGLLSHAKASLFLNPKASCPIVEAEIRARVKGVNGWVDPHNHGTYTMLHDEAGVMKLKRVTGNGKYTDMLMFTFSDWGGDYGCQVTACSESQVNSFLDMSTNFCNLHDLYCGKQDGCPVAGQDIGEYKEELRTFSLGAGKDKSKCIVKESALAAVATAEPTALEQWQHESVTAEPCCNKECKLPLVKYFSTDAAHGFCGEACMDPKKFNTYHRFEANLTRATSEHPCSEQYTPDNAKEYTDYFQTVTHGFPGILTVTLDLYAPKDMPDHSCCAVQLVPSLHCAVFPGKSKEMKIFGTGPYCCPSYSGTETEPCSKVDNKAPIIV